MSTIEVNGTISYQSSCLTAESGAHNSTCLSQLLPFFLKLVFVICPKLQWVFHLYFLTYGSVVVQSLLKSPISLSDDSLHPLPPTDDSSAYDTIKSHTKANLRAALHNVETAVEGSTATTTMSSTAATPPQTSLVSPPSTHSILQLHLDIAAPRILFPGRLWPSPAEAEAEREGRAPCPPASLLGVICDLGRFRLSNWEPSAATATNGYENGKQVVGLAFD